MVIYIKIMNFGNKKLIHNKFDYHIDVNSVIKNLNNNIHSIVDIN